MRNRLLNALKDRFASEAGFAVPTVTLMTLAALGMAGVAVTVSIGGQGGAVRDQNTKTALAVAESGAEQALLQFNRYGLVSETAPCAPVGGTTVEADGWCPERQAGVNGGTVSYRVRPAWTQMPSGDVAWTEIEVISEGTLNGVTRRLDVTANSSAGQNIFVDASVKSQDGIKVDKNASIHAGLATNGELTLEGEQCGTATVGIGKKKPVSGEYFTDIDCTAAGGEPDEAEIDLPPVNQGNAATENDNGRLFSLDTPSSKNANAACFNGFNGKGKPDSSCGPRELRIDSNNSVTLHGAVYSLCKLTLKSNTSLFVAPGAKAKIYFDSPEACGYDEPPVVQLDLSSNAVIAPQSGSAADLALLFVGSQDIATELVLSSNTSVNEQVDCTQNFVVYGPYTDIELASETSFCGAMAGQTVEVNSNSEIRAGTGAEEFFLPLTAPHYVPSRFIDCAATVAAVIPDEGC